MRTAPFNRRKPWSQPLADLVRPCLAPAVARHGFAEADLLLYWPDIVGARLAERCQPVRMARPVRGQGGEAATLIVRVEGAYALDLQHQAGVVIERVNAHAGWRCVARLALRQAPLVRGPQPRLRVEPPPAEAIDRAQAVTAAVGDGALREALTRLGSRVLAGGAQT